MVIVYAVRKHFANSHRNLLKRYLDIHLIETEVRITNIINDYFTVKA